MNFIPKSHAIRNILVALAGILGAVFSDYLYVTAQLSGIGAEALSYLTILLVFIGFIFLNSTLEAIGLTFVWFFISIFVVLKTHIMFGGHY